MKALKKYRWPLTGALLGVLVFLAVYGVRVLDPTSVDWILNSLSPDPIQHYLGWELFRRSPVHLPYIGANYNAVYPFRTSVLFTDSLPLAALFARRYGGAFTLESRPGRGVCVALSLPLCSAARLPQPPQAAALLADRFSPVYVQLAPRCVLPD